MSYPQGVTPIRRAMVIPAGAATYYPTGVPLGVINVSGSATGVDTATRSVTSTDSWFHDVINGDVGGYTGPMSMRKAANLIKFIPNGPGAAGTIAIQTHNGSALMGPFDLAVARDISFGTDDGILVEGGFRVVTVGATSAGVLIWEEIER